MPAPTTSAGSDAPGVVLVGAGMVAELHERAIRLGGHLRLVGLVDVRADHARQRAAEWGCRAYPTLTDALADDAVDAVLVLTPPEEHEATALEALRAGRSVLVEKPVGTPETIARLQAEAEGRGLVCMPAHNYAYQPEFTRTRRLLADGSFGRPRAAWITYVIRHPEDVAQHYGGVLEEVMIHHTYLGLALFGAPEVVYAGRMEPAWEHLQTEDQAWMTWEYPEGLSVHHFATFAIDDNTSDASMFEVKVLGERGGSSYNWRSCTYQRSLGSLSLAVPDYEDSYIHEQDAFARAIAGDPNAIVSDIGQAAEAMRILDLAHEADAKKIGIQPDPNAPTPAAPAQSGGPS